MKTIKNILLIAVALLSLSSCEDFLDDRPEATAGASKTDYTKAENTFLSVSAAYASMRSNTAHGFAYIGLFEIAGDNADKGSTSDDSKAMQEIDAFTFKPANSFFNEIWGAYFDIVSAANFAIVEMPKYEQALQLKEDKDYAMRCQAEAKVIRAYAYFNLVRMFGRVPKVDTVYTSSELATLPQEETAALYDFIEQDLNEAIALLPDSYTKAWAGRINKFTALGIKAKVHMYHASVEGADKQAQWNKVTASAGEIIASKRYWLLKPFRSVFLADGENSAESLFEIQSSTLGRTTGESAYLEYAFYQAPRGNSPGNLQGWGFCVPSDSLLAFFDRRNDTIREAVTVLRKGTKTPEGDSIKVGCTNPYYNGKVYTPASENNWSYNGYGFDYNIRILRYADVLLMYAEALEQGGTPHSGVTEDADGAMNLVRERAGLEQKTGYSLDEILDERRAELAMEEDRFFDLVRTGKAAVALKSKGFTPGTHELYPIPAAQRNLNKKLTQNSGY